MAYNWQKRRAAPQLQWPRVTPHKRQGPEMPSCKLHVSEHLNGGLSVTTPVNVVFLASRIGPRQSESSEGIRPWLTHSPHHHSLTWAAAAETLGRIWLAPEERMKSGELNSEDQNEVHYLCKFMHRELHAAQPAPLWVTPPPALGSSVANCQ